MSGIGSGKSHGLSWSLGGGFYQFLCPTPLPHYDSTDLSLYGGILTGSAVGVNLALLPKTAAEQNEKPLTDAMVFATGSSVETPPEGIEQFPRGTLAAEFFLQKVPWQIDGLGFDWFAPSNYKTDENEGIKLSQAIARPWFTYSSFIGNLNRTNYGNSYTVGDIGYDVPPTLLKGEYPTERYMQPDADWPNNNASTVSANGKKYILFLTADFKLHVWKDNITVDFDVYDSPYADQNQTVTIDTAQTKVIEIPLPSWATISEVTFRDQLRNETLPGVFPVEPRVQGHFRHDGLRMAAILIERKASESTLKCRAYTPSGETDINLNYIDYGTPQVSAYSESPTTRPRLYDVKEDSLGWAEWSITIVDSALHDEFEVVVSLLRHTPPSASSYEMPMAMGYAEPHDWQNGVQTGDLLTGHLQLYTDENFRKVCAWHLGVPHDLTQLEPSFARIILRNQTQDQPILTLNLSDKRIFNGMPSQHLFNACRAEEGYTFYANRIFDLDLTRLSFLAIINQIHLEVKDELIENYYFPSSPHPQGYPIECGHTVYAIGAAYGQTIFVDELANQTAGFTESSATQLLYHEPTFLADLQPLKVQQKGRTSLYFSGIQFDDLAHWAYHFLLRKQTGVDRDDAEDGTPPPYRMREALYPDSSTQRPFSDAFALVLAQIRDEILSVLPEFEQYEETITSIIENDLAAYLNLRFPVEERPFDYEFLINTAFLYYTQTFQSSVGLRNQLQAFLQSKGLYASRVSYSRPLMLQNDNGYQRLYHETLVRSVAQTQFFRPGPDGWMACSASLLVPVKKYRMLRMFLYGKESENYNDHTPDFDGELRYFANSTTTANTADGFTRKEFFEEDTLQLKQIDHFINANEGADYKHLDFYNHAYRHSYTHEDFDNTITIVNEGLAYTNSQLATYGVYLIAYYEVDHPIYDGNAYYYNTEPFEIFSEPLMNFLDKNIAVGKHFFVGSKGWNNRVPIDD